MPSPGGHDRGSIRARLLAVIAELAVVRDGSLRWPLEIEVRGPGGVVTFRVESPADLQLDPLAGLSDYDRAVVEAAGPDPVPRKRLATLAGKTFNRNFHDAVRRLTAGQGAPLREDSRGVWRP